MTAILSHAWLDASIAAASELATTSLGYAAPRVLSRHQQLPTDMAGFWVALVGNCAAVQVGLGASIEDCHSLARAFLRLGPSDGALSHEDMVDALGEMANVIAGGVKRRMVHADPSTQLGLPIVMNGSVEASEHTQVAVADIAFGAVRARLMVLCVDRSGGRP